MSKWPKVKLGEVISHRKEHIELDDLKTYKRCRVQLHGRGIILRDRIEGSVIKTKKQQVCRTDELLVAEIDAKVGGYGIVPPSLAGAIVSGHYFLFETNSERLRPDYLGYFIKTRYFGNQVKAHGSTNYAAIRPKHVLDYEIPLPPLPEQHRIVAKLDHLAQKISEAQRLTEQSTMERAALLESMIAENNCIGIKKIPIGELVGWRRPDVEVEASRQYSFAGVYSFGRGVFCKHTLTGMDFSYDKLTRLRAGEFTYPKLMAWEGAFGIVPDDCDGCHVSPEFPVFTPDKSKVLPETLDVHFKSPSVWKSIADLSSGTNLRRRRLNPSVFLKYEFPLPPMKMQLRLRKTAGIINQSKTALSSIEGNLEAILPAILGETFNH
jgi:type I restriction enzyme S subunit